MEGLREADPDLGFQARMMALCSPASTARMPRFGVRCYRTLSNEITG